MHDYLEDHDKIIMEKEKENKRSILYKIIIIVLLIIIITLLFKTQQAVRQRIEAFDENPLLFGAVKYDINQCSCTNNKNNLFYFDQNKLWVENVGELAPLNFSLNISYPFSIEEQ